MKKLSVLFTINLLLPFLFLIVLPSLFITDRLDSSNTISSRLLSLTSDRPATFNFNPSHNFINQLDLQLKNPQILNNSRIIVNVSSYTSDQDIVFYGSNVGDPSWVTLKLKPIVNSSHSGITVNIDTDNPQNDSLYLVTDAYNQPNYRAYYATGNFVDNLKSNIIYQLDRFKQRQLTFNLFYISLLLVLNIYIFKTKWY